jgi:hypothetical protein
VSIQSEFVDISPQKVTENPTDVANPAPVAVDFSSVPQLEDNNSWFVPVVNVEPLSTTTSSTSTTTASSTATTTAPTAAEEYYEYYDSYEDYYYD